MTTPTAPVATRWPLSRVLVLLLAAAFLGLMADIRVEHIDIVRETWKGWIPIAYAAFMAIASLAAVIFWNPLIRNIMLILFPLAFIVGGLGFYFHNQDHLTKVPTQTLSAWTNLKMKRLHGPPELAPLAFAGLGLLGLFGSLKRFN
jgi:predicted lysophospholipase L1 biosynthesis ABC-type transport system permease subunit